MANGQTAAQTDEDSVSSILGGSDDQGGSPEAGGPTPTQTPAVAPRTAAAPPSTPQPAVQVDSSQKVHPHVAILAGLVNKILSGIQNAPGNPNNPLDRGFMNASPRNQQLQEAQVSKAMSEADQAKLQTSITGMKALQLEYMIKRLPQDLQNEHLKAISDFKTNLIKEGASVEAEGNDEKASDMQAFHLNGTDPRATGHAGRFYSLPTMDADGKAKFDVVYVPNKDTLQNDFKWTDANGDDQTIPAGTPISSALARFVEAQNKGAQNQTKEQHKQMADALGSVADDKAEATANFLEREQKQNTPLYQQNKAAVDATIPNLRKQATQAKQEKRTERVETAADIAAAVGAVKAAQKSAGTYYHWIGSDGETKVGKGTEVPEGIEATPIGGEKEFAQYTAESHISNIVQQSLNRIHRDIDEHPELFDNAAARNILATTLEQIDRSSVGMLIAGTGGSIPLPSGMGDMINTALQNNALNATTADAVKQYIADYKAMKDKAISMQMEMQGGKIGRGSAQAFKSITDQIPNGATADSRSAHRQMNDLQDTQNELSKKYGDYGDFRKIEPYKPNDKGQSSTDIKREKEFERAGKQETRIEKLKRVLIGD